MVDLVYELGGSLDIKNRQGLTPLTLAAVKARKEVKKNLEIYFYEINFLRCLIISSKKLVQFIGNMAM
jgi:hypothetical protein